MNKNLEKTDTEELIEGLIKKTTRVYQEGRKFIIKTETSSRKQVVIESSCNLEEINSKKIILKRVPNVTYDERPYFKI